MNGTYTENSVRNVDEQDMHDFVLYDLLYVPDTPTLRHLTALAS
jgi:hypothetical protein